MTDKLVLSMKLIEAYNKLLHRVYDACTEAGDKLKPNLEKRLEDAAALDELSNEVSDYLRRDIEAAAQWMANNENSELSDWLRFDIEQVESQVLGAFSQLADQTTLELKQLEQTANEIGEWHTGEIVGIGSLTCIDCGEEIHFHSTGHVPPCPKCHGTRFKRHS